MASQLLLISAHNAIDQRVNSIVDEPFSQIVSLHDGHVWETLSVLRACSASPFQLR